jgi:hypothetical protein
VPLRSEGVDDHAVVGAVGRRLDDHAALDAEHRVQGLRDLPGRGRHLVGRIGAHGVALARPEDMELAVAGERRRQRHRRTLSSMKRHCASTVAAGWPVAGSTPRTLPLSSSGPLRQAAGTGFLWAKPSM